jgi:hypothetical protein
MSEEKKIDFDDDKKKEETDSKQQQKEEVAKVYGINLSDIEEVVLPNGKEYFKFYNPEDRSLRMIENRRDYKNLSQQFKEIQEKLGFSQGIDDKQNAKAIFDYQLKYNNIELNLIPIRELKNNKGAYKHLFNGLDIHAKKAIRVLLENMDFLDLEYINLENMLGIDKNRNVIRAEYDYQTGKCKLMAAEVRNYETDKVTVDSNGYIFEISDAEFDAAIETIDVAGDDPNIIEEHEINGIERKNTTIHGREVNLSYAVHAYKYPEIIEKSDMSRDDKFLYRGIIAAIHRKRQRILAMYNSKQYVLKNQNKKQNQAAFIDSILLSLLLGFFSGILVALVYLTIKMNI